MSKFKVGDKVKRINSSFGNINKGDILIIENTYQNGTLGFNNLTNKFDQINFELVNKSKSTVDKSNEWTFIIHDIHQINIEEIREHLTVDNPVALVTIKKNKNRYALAIYHRSILVKAELFKILIPTLNEVGDFSKAVKFIKTVRQISWEKPEQLVTVRIPEL